MNTQNTYQIKWEEDNLENLLTLIIDHRGKTPKKLGSNWVLNGIPALSAKNIKTGQIVNPQDVKYVDNNLYKRWMPEKLQAEDILMTSEAPLGELFFLKEKSDYVLSQRVFGLRTNKDLLDPRYLYYYLQSPEGAHELKRRISGTAAQGIRQAELRKIKISYPKSINEQRSIANFLSALDDKIEANNKIANTLSQMAQTIFKEWFVNFKFPGYKKAKFIDSELGKIPEEWRVESIKDMCLSISDGDWIETKDQGGVDYRLLQISNIAVDKFMETGNFRFISEVAFKKLNCTEILPGNILVARMPDPTGRAWLVTKMPWKMVGAVDIAILKPNLQKISKFFLPHYLNLPSTLAFIKNLTIGTTRSRLAKRDLEKMQLILPPLKMQKKWEFFVKDAHNKKILIQNENKSLSIFRDLLLPKLMRGEIRV